MYAVNLTTVTQLYLAADILIQRHLLITKAQQILHRRAEACHHLAQIAADHQANPFETTSRVSLESLGSSRIRLNSAHISC